MYRLGKRRRRISKRLLWSATGLVLVVGIVVSIVYLLRPNTTLNQNVAAQRTLTVPQTSTKHFDQGIFSIDLPSDWEFVVQQRAPLIIYQFKATAKNNDARNMDIYVDSPPTNFAINRLLPVVANVDSLLVNSEVSENCTTYTDIPTAPSAQVGVKATWQGIGFLCDGANTERNVTGTGSSDGLNTVKLTGQVSGPHQFFFTYTDHAFRPDYTIFYKALQSFKLK